MFNPKKNEKIRFCIELEELNIYLLPKIDLLVDSTVGYVMLSFMDGYSDYNQIRLASHE